MTTFTISNNASLEGESSRFSGQIEGLYSGSAIDKMAACRLASDGKVYMASANYKTSGSASDFIGFCPKAVSANKPVVLKRAFSIAGYSDGDLTAGKNLYIAGSATPGQLTDTPVFTGDDAVAVALNSKNILIVK